MRFLLPSSFPTSTATPSQRFFIVCFSSTLPLSSLATSPFGRWFAVLHFFRVWFFWGYFTFRSLRLIPDLSKCRFFPFDALLLLGEMTPCCFFATLWFRELFSQFFSCLFDCPFSFSDDDYSLLCPFRFVPECCAFLDGSGFI